MQTDSCLTVTNDRFWTHQCLQTVNPRVIWLIRHQSSSQSSVRFPDTVELRAARAALCQQSSGTAHAHTPLYKHTHCILYIFSNKTQPGTFLRIKLIFFHLSLDHYFKVEARLYLFLGFVWVKRGKTIYFKTVNNGCSTHCIFLPLLRIYCKLTCLWRQEVSH